MRTLCWQKSDPLMQARKTLPSINKIESEDLKLRESCSDRDSYAHPDHRGQGLVRLQDV